MGLPSQKLGSVALMSLSHMPLSPPNATVNLLLHKLYHDISNVTASPDARHETNHGVFHDASELLVEIEPTIGLVFACRLTFIE